MAKMGIQELKELVDLPLSAVGAFKEAHSDGVIDMKDLGQLLVLIPKVAPAFEGVEKVPAEFADLDAEEAAELCAFVVAKLAVTDEKAKLVLDAALRAAASVLGLVRAFQA